ncbi:hypothetical protein NDU88_001788 [Pleurodeles waltl]|uniref:Uncharacterized protein n=1 Tax=Pleurodeles waltl TaxID=8319 RepID=A0AAV7NDI0_PLEWA|nr:hypothetical protein NDU88_001788 [Pleurodeles waltl]
MPAGGGGPRTRKQQRGRGTEAGGSRLVLRSWGASSGPETGQRSLTRDAQRKPLSREGEGGAAGRREGAANGGVRGAGPQGGSGRERRARGSAQGAKNTKAQKI